jgi:hypothetical protein
MIVIKKDFQDFQEGRPRLTSGHSAEKSSPFRGVLLAIKEGNGGKATERPSDNLYLPRVPV